MLQLAALTQFTCLGDRCEDTCCQGWSMQVDEATRTRYAERAPELLQDVVEAEEGGWIMRKDPATSLCVRLEGGLCGIHKKYGDGMLGDACHFYPRVTRQLGGQVLRTATLSCPEIARLTLFTDPQPLQPADNGRLPFTLRNYLPDAMSPEEALTVHKAFLDAACDTTASAEQIFLRIARTSRSLDILSQKDWHLLTAFYIKDADLRLPEAQANISDAFNLLHMLCGVIVATRKAPSPRLRQTLADMEAALASRLDWDNVTIQVSEQHALNALEAVRTAWTQHAGRYGPILRRWLYMQLGLGLHPFAGLGPTPTDRATLMGVRLAMLKLALISAHVVRGPLPDAEIVRIVQSLSRLLDHLGDSAFSLSICNETGWSTEPRLRGLLSL